MAERDGLELFRSAALEALAVAIPAALFFALSIRVYQAPAEGMAPHAWLLALLWAGLLSLRALLGLLPRAFGQSIVALLMATFFLLLLVYYASALVGLDFWGRVTSWRLVETYVAKAPSLLAALDLSPSLVYASAALVGGVAVGAAWWIWRKDWVAELVRRGSLLTALIVGLAGSGSAFAGLVRFFGDDHAAAGEPVSLTFFPERAQPTGHANVMSAGHAALVARDEQARREYRPARDAHRRNVIVIVGDALRRDHLGVLGYERETTPYLSSLAKEGRVRSGGRMYSVCSASHCGLMGIASAKYVHEFSNSSITLLEVLGLHGYASHFILSGDHTNFYALREAYGRPDSFFDGASSHRYMNDDELVFDRLAELAPYDGRPTYLQFHLMAAHPLGVKEARFQRWQPAESYWQKRWAGSKRSPQFNETTRNYYDAGVLALDDHVRRIAALLEAKGYLDDALLVVTGDHGEMLGEYGVVGHNSGVHEGALSIPFVLVDFGNKPATPFPDVTLTSQVDIAPTLLHELGMPIPSSWSGVPLQRGVKRDTVYFQHESTVGLFARDQDRILQYAVDVARHDEFLRDVTAPGWERENLVDRSTREVGRLRLRAIRSSGTAQIEDAL